jgi:sugar lactone lactonase YvrE
MRCSMWTFSRAVLAALAVLIFTPIFVRPSLAADIAAGDILVADPGDGTIRHYSAQGADLGVFASGLTTPGWITADQDGNIYVSEHDGQTVTKFSPGGVVLLTIRTKTTTDDYKPGGVRVATDGTIYVVDSSTPGGRIVLYENEPFGARRCAFPASLSADPFMASHFMASDADGNLYVTDAGEDAGAGVVRRFSNFSPDCANPAGEDFVTGLFDPSGIALDTRGNLYVASSTSHFVEKFPPDPGQPIFAQVFNGSASYFGIAFDASGNLYVANFAEGNIHKFPPTGGAQPEVLRLAGLVHPRDLLIVPLVNPTVKDECKQDGWLSFNSFNNQGDCIQFVNTGKQ